MEAGDGEAGINDGAGGAAGQKTRAKNRERVELVKAIGQSLFHLDLVIALTFISFSSQYSWETAHVNQCIYRP